jgi:uncharacterized protein (DUF488 family)
LPGAAKTPQALIPSDVEQLQQGCLLCSEHLPHHCHRRLVAEYLNAKWGGLETQHLI